MSIRALLMDIESRYADAFDELGPGASRTSSIS